MFSAAKVQQLFEIAKYFCKKLLKKPNSGELDEKVVCANFAQTTQHGAIEGKTQTTESNSSWLINNL
jgi:hypothetical protein